MTNFEDIFGNIFAEASQYNQNSKLEIELRKSEFEKNLDDMWIVYGKGNISQIVEYQKELQRIKNAGCKVLRNSQGKHKIII